MNHEAIQIIKSEHRALAAVLNAGRYLCNEIELGNIKPDFSLLEAIIRYIEEFPEVFHHPKEDRHLFAKISLRTHLADSLLSELTRQHAEGLTLTKDLRDNLERYQLGKDGAAASFFDKMNAFIKFNFQHMTVEEDSLIPIAEDCLLENDWHEIVSAFRDNKDPLWGTESASHFRELFHQIVLLSPAPIGLAS